MKVLIVTQYFWPEEFRINDCVESLVKRGHEVTVLTGIPNYPGGRYFEGYGLFKNRKQTYKGAQVYRVPLIPRGKKSNMRLALNYLSFVISGCFLAPWYCRKSYDCIFVFEVSPITVALPAIIIRKIKKAPLFLWVLDLWPETLSAVGAIKSPRIMGWVRQLVRFIYKRTDCILTSSKGFISSIKRISEEHPNIRYFPNWGEPVYESPVVDKTFVEGVDIPDGFKVMFAGNVGLAQGFETVVAAAEQLKNHTDIHWLIVGEGRMSDWVKQQVQDKGLTNVHLMGRRPIESMPTFFSYADAMLVALKKDEIFSLTVPGKVQSYMACGKPIIASLTGEGNALITEAGAGLTCESEDPEKLAEIVLEMSRMSDEDRQAMGDRGKHYYEENFKRSMLFDRLESWMKEAVYLEK